MKIRPAKPADLLSDITVLFVVLFVYYDNKIVPEPSLQFTSVVLMSQICTQRQHHRVCIGSVK